MATELERLLVTIDASTEGLRRELARMDRGLTDAVRTTERHTRSMAGQFERVNAAIITTRNIIGTVIAARAVRGIVEYSDTWKRLEGRLRIFHETASDVAAIENQLYALAQRNRSSLEGVTNLYTRLQLSAGQNVTAQKNLLQVTEAVAKGIAITGETAASARGAIIQFSQALSSNFKTAGQEINSLVEQAPRVAKAIVDGLKKTGVVARDSTSDLKTLAKDGFLNADNVVKALVSQLGVLQNEFDKTQITVGQAFGALDNAFLRYIGQSDAIAGGTSSIALAVKGLADNFDTLADAAVLAGTALTARLGAGLAVQAGLWAANTRQIILYNAALARMAGVSVTATASTTALNRTLSVFGGPVVAVITALGVGLAYYKQEADATEEVQDRLNKRLERNRDISSDLIGASKDRAEQLREERKALIEKTKAEIEDAKILLVKLKIQEQSTMRAQGSFVTGKIGAGPQALNLSDSAKQAKANVKALEEALSELENSFKDISTGSGGSGGSGGSVGSATNRMKEFREELERSIPQLQALAMANEMSAEAYEALKTQQEAENEALKAGFKIGTQAYKQTVEMILVQKALEKSIADTTEAREEERKKQQELVEAFIRQQQEAAEKIDQLFVHAFENIQDALADMLVEGKFTADSLVRIFKQAAAEITAAMVIKPVFQAVVGGVTGEGGRSSGSSGSGLGGQLLQTGISKGIGLSSIGAGIDAFGASALPGLFGTGIGPTPLAAGLGGAPAATGALSSIGIGLSSIAIPVAALAFTALLGKFGSRPHPASTFSFEGFTGTGAGRGIDIRAKHLGTEIGQGFADAITGSLQSIAQLGVNFGNLNGNAPGQQILQGGVDDGRGWFNFNGQRFNFDPNNQEQANTAMAQLIVAMTQAAGNFSDVFSAEVQPALAKASEGGREIAEVLNDIAFIANFNRLSEAPRVLSQTEQAVAQITASFAAAREQAERLGLSLDKVAQGQALALGQVRDAFTDDLTASLLDIMDPAFRQFRDEAARYQQQLRDAIAVGASPEVFAQIEMLHRLNEERIRLLVAETEATTQARDAASEAAKSAQELVNKYTGIFRSFGDLISQLTVGSLSALSPQARLSALRGQIGALGASARLGDAAAAEELAKLLPEFVQLSGEVNGFNRQFSADQQMALDLSRAVKDVADRQTVLQQGILDTASAQLAALSDQTALLRGILEKMGGSTAAAAQGNANDLVKSLIASGSLSDASAQAIFRSAGYTGGFGGGLAQAALDANPTLNAAVFSKLRLAGFASGGVVTGGIAGRDSVPAMLMPGEAVIRADQVRSANAAQLAALTQGRLPAGNDNSTLERKVDTLTRAVEGLVRVTAASGDLQSELLQDIQSELATMANAARLHAAR